MKITRPCIKYYSACENSCMISSVCGFRGSFLMSVKNNQGDIIWVMGITSGLQQKACVGAGDVESAVIHEAATLSSWCTVAVLGHRAQKQHKRPYVLWNSCGTIIFALLRAGHEKIHSLKVLAAGDKIHNLLFRATMHSKTTRLRRANLVWAVRVRQINGEISGYNLFGTHRKLFMSLSLHLKSYRGLYDVHQTVISISWT